MDFYELISELREDEEVEAAAMRHNFNGASGFDIPAEMQTLVQEAARTSFGETIELYHGSLDPIAEDLIWQENSSFTDEFDIEFAGEDGYIAVAQVPTDRIKFYLEEENEFVITGGKLECEIFTVREYFSL